MAGPESWSAHRAGDDLRRRDYRDGVDGDIGGIFKTLGLYRRDSVSDLRFDPRRQQVQSARADGRIFDLGDLLSCAIRDRDRLFAGKDGRETILRVVAVG